MNVRFMVIYPTSKTKGVFMKSHNFKGLHQSLTEAAAGLKDKVSKNGSSKLCGRQPLKN